MKIKYRKICHRLILCTVSFYFHLLWKSTFFVNKGLSCLYELNKNYNIWLLVDMEFLFFCVQLDISLVKICHRLILCTVSFYFHLLWKSTFFVNKGLSCLYELNKNYNIWLLVDMEFLFFCVQLDISLVSYLQVKHSKKNSISMHTHVLFSL